MPRDLGPRHEHPNKRGSGTTKEEVPGGLGSWPSEEKPCQPQPCSEGATQGVLVEAKSLPGDENWHFTLGSWIKSLESLMPLGEEGLLQKDEAPSSTTKEITRVIRGGQQLLLEKTPSEVLWKMEAAGSRSQVDFLGFPPPQKVSSVTYGLVSSLQEGRNFSYPFLPPKTPQEVFRCSYSAHHLHKGCKVI